MHPRTLEEDIENFLKNITDGRLNSLLIEQKANELLERIQARNEYLRSFK